MPLSTAVSESEFTKRVLQNAFDLWFEPEIKRRQESGTLPTPFKLWAAQVILDLGQPPEINFNEQLKGALAGEMTGPVEVGQQVSLAEIGDLGAFHLTTEHPDAGHLTAVMHRGKWYLFFDFRYNASRIDRHFRVAQQFVDTAAYTLEKGYLNAGIENLFAAVELMAKSLLLIHPDERLLAKTKHRFVATEFNRYGKHDNVPREFVETLNELSNVRNRARFPDDDLDVSNERVAGWLETARKMATYLDEVRPDRLDGSLPGPLQSDMSEGSRPPLVDQDGTPSRDRTWGYALWVALAAAMVIAALVWLN